MPHKARPEHWHDLANVLTLAQAAREYHISRQSLTYAIDAENIAAIRCGRTVLVSRRSLDHLYKRKTASKS